MAPMDLLGVSADTLPRLKSYPDFNLDCYTCQQDDVNNYMQAHYHKATKPLVEVSGPSTDNKQNWLTAKKAASIIGCSMSAIKKLRIGYKSV